MLVKHCHVCILKTFILNKITNCIVNLLNLRNIPIQVRKLLHTLQNVVWKEKQHLAFKEKLLEIISVFFHIFKLKQ